MNRLVRGIAKESTALGFVFASMRRKSLRGTSRSEEVGYACEEHGEFADTNVTSCGVGYI